MKRRALLQNIMLASGALVALPSWAEGWEIKTLHSNGWFSPSETSLISAVVSTIIPDGKDPGALKVGVDKFLIKLFEDCYTEENRKSIQAGLLQLDEHAQKNYGTSFSNCTQQQKEEILKKMADSSNKSEKDFFNTMKSETIRGYSTSKEVMVNYFKYKVVPGHWYGCINVNV
jgi:Gluconate 2-dehydrogenase subunit 3